MNAICFYACEWQTKRKCECANTNEVVNATTVMLGRWTFIDGVTPRHTRETTCIGCTSVSLRTRRPPTGSKSRRSTWANSHPPTGNDAAAHSQLRRLALLLGDHPCYTCKVHRLPLQTVSIPTPGKTKTSRLLSVTHAASHTIKIHSFCLLNVNIACIKLLA